jgi:Carboxypeptidase regulatory-like domain
MYTAVMRLLLFLVILVAFALAALGQSDGGSIRGTVTSPTGKMVANAPVQAKNTETGSVYKAASLATGQYTLQGLPAGSYDVSVVIPGLRGYQQKGIRVEAAKTSSLDIHLQEGTQLSTLGEDPLAIAADRRRHTPPSGPTPRTADGKPDLSGVWWSPVVVDPGKPEWLPFAQKVAKERSENNRKDSPQAHCLPAAVLRRGPLIEFVQSKNFLIEISDDDSPGFHQIYLSRHEHPQDPDPLWYGDSIGHWEGDTLVVDRVNFDDRVWLDQDGHPHGENLHVIERYRRPDLGHLEAVVTVDDPAVLARPYTYKRVSDLANEEIREFMCNEDNTDLPHFR